MRLDTTLKAQSNSGILESVFKLSERKTTIGTELYAGFITFLAMSYILAVNPAILGSIPGMDKGAYLPAPARALRPGSLLWGFWG
ncbi:xanthine/uracil/vitamin C permease, partial [Vibrio xuii]